MKCPECGAYYPNHSFECLRQERNTGPGGNVLPLLAAPFALLAVPFVVVVFPLASSVAVLAALGIYALIRQAVGDNAAFWWTFFLSLIPFLAALNAEQWAERLRGYRIARHLLRVLGIPLLAAQYLMYLPAAIRTGGHAPSFAFFQFLGQIVTRPGVLATMIVLALIAHWAGSNYDLGGRRPASWTQFFRLRQGPLFEAAPAASVGKPALPLSRKLLIAAGLGFGVGIVETFIATDYDSAVMVILRVGTLCTVLFAIVVAAHHAFTRKRASATSP